jgi:hypothetical protein
MKKIITHDWSRNREPVDTLTLGCLDRRFKGWRKLFGELMGFNMSFPLTLPGGVKDLVYPKHPRDAEHLLEKISLLIHHYPNLKLVLMGHEECLDCAQCSDPTFYEDMLQQAGNLLRERFPKQETFLVFVAFDGIYLVEQAVCMAVV